MRKMTMLFRTAHLGTPGPVTRRAAPVALAAILAAGGAATILVTAASPVGATDPFRAGEAGIVTTILPDAARAVAVSRASRLQSALALPSASRWETARVNDRFVGMTYDEATAYDAAGNVVALHRFDPQGRLVALAQLGWHAAGRALADEAAAVREGGRLAQAAGFQISGTARVARTPSGNGWRVSWPRLVDGIPVAGDGVRLELWPDGTLHAAVRTERALAARPATLIDRTAAVAAAEARLAESGTEGNAAIGDVELRWVAPNDAFTASLPDAPATELRLAWVVRAAASGALASEIRGVEVYVDAGSGSVLGGDAQR